MRLLFLVGEMAGEHKCECEWWWWWWGVDRGRRRDKMQVNILGFRSLSEMRCNTRKYFERGVEDRRREPLCKRYTGQKVSECSCGKLGNTLFRHV